jgi:hypothetical protein
MTFISSPRPRGTHSDSRVSDGHRTPRPSGTQATSVLHPPELETLILHGPGESAVGATEVLLGVGLKPLAVELNLTNLELLRDRFFSMVVVLTGRKPISDDKLAAGLVDDIRRRTLGAHHRAHGRGLHSQAHRRETHGARGAPGHVRRLSAGERALPGGQRSRGCREQPFGLPFRDPGLGSAREARVSPPLQRPDGVPFASA